MKTPTLDDIERLRLEWHRLMVVAMWAPDEEYAAAAERLAEHGRKWEIARRKVYDQAEREACTRPGR